MNEPVMVIQATLFTSIYNYWVLHALTPFLQSIIFIETDLYLWTLSHCKQTSLWLLLRKQIIPRCIFLEYGHSSAERQIQQGRFKMLFASVQGLSMLLICFKRYISLNVVISFLNNYLLKRYNLVISLHTDSFGSYHDSIFRF